MKDRRAEKPVPPAAASAGKPSPSPDAASVAGAGARPGGGWDDDDEPWRHEPIAPKDENPLESLGRSVSEVLTGPLKDGASDDKPKS